jgi:hypothetical protein
LPNPVLSTYDERQCCSAPRCLKIGLNPLLSEIISLVSVTLALIAICISAWQARLNIRHARHSRSLPVIAEIFREWRSEEFRKSVRNLLALSPRQVEGRDFLNLPGDCREDAFKVCYFFDYIGTLVAFGIISEDIVISTMGTQIMQVWSAMYPVIRSERERRSKAFPSSTPPGFLTFYGHIVACIESLGGGQAAKIIQKKNWCSSADK